MSIFNVSICHSLLFQLKCTEKPPSNTGTFWPYKDLGKQYYGRSPRVQNHLSHCGAISTCCSPFLTDCTDRPEVTKSQGSPKAGSCHFTVKYSSLSPATEQRGLQILGATNPTVVGSRSHQVHNGRQVFSTFLGSLGQPWCPSCGTTALSPDRTWNWALAGLQLQCSNSQLQLGQAPWPQGL